MNRPDLNQLQPGDPVVITDPDRPGTTPLQAFVIKAARVWITLGDGAPDDGRTHRTEWRMRRDSQSQATGYGRGGRRFATLEQHAWDQRLAAATAYLRDQGITIGSSSEWSAPDRIMQLADLIRNAH